MQPNFWHERWKNREIAFHANEANPHLVKHIGRLNLSPGSRIFLPLCGKTLDIGWLLGQGYRVAGAELSEVAVGELFAELRVVPQISDRGRLKLYSAPGIDVYVGDIFDLTAAELGKVDAVYDRAALVALPPEMRVRYAAHLQQITQTAPQLLICFEYDQTLTAGPPFAIGAAEVQQHYAATYKISQLTNEQLAGGLRGKVPAHESVWLLA